MRAFEYRHVVGFEETNLVGNVYYVNHLRWQGRCRELFLREYVPQLVAELQNGLCLVTTRCSCEYLNELAAFDDIKIRMRLGSLRQNRVTMIFDYLRNSAEGDELVARGEQEVAFMRRVAGQVVPEPIPADLKRALLAYAEPDNDPQDHSRGTPTLEIEEQRR